MDATLFQIISELARLHNLAHEQGKQIEELTQMNFALGDENARLKNRVVELEAGVKSLEMSLDKGKKR